jgi:hypothetical protein
MYTNIDTTQCIKRLTNFLTHPATLTSFPHLSPEPLIEALHIVMHNNRMHFGDMYIHQHKGIAMLLQLRTSSLQSMKRPT